MTQSTWALGSKMRSTTQRFWFVCTFVLLTATAWLTLWLWAQSPYGRYLDHGDWTRIGFANSICLVIPAGNIVLPASLYIGGWLVMLVAMMLPTSLPLLDIYRRLTRNRPDKNLLLGLVILGYLGAWVGFGVITHIADLVLREIVIKSVWLTVNGWAVGASVVALAGAFQFSEMKYRCLDKCRLPLSFVMQYWRGRAERTGALRLGLHHGIYCVGCCWALMLLMFIVGTGNVGWMLLLGAAMAIEKNLPWGRRLSPVLGVGLLAWAGSIVVFESPIF